MGGNLNLAPNLHTLYVYVTVPLAQNFPNPSTPITPHGLNLTPAGLEISTCPIAQASVKATWASTNPRLFAAFIKGTGPMVSAVKCPLLVISPWAN